MPLTRRNLISSAAAIAATTAGMSKANARTRGMRVSRHRIPWPGDKKLRVLHLTDIHVGWSTPQAVLRRCVEVAHRLEMQRHARRAHWHRIELHRVHGVERQAALLRQLCSCFKLAVFQQPL